MSKSTAVLAGFRDQPDDELKALLATTRDELFRLHLGQHTNQVTSSAQLLTKRRHIAQILTVLNGRKHGLEAQAAAKTAEAPAAEEAPAKKTKAKKAKS
ncbi:MAG: 50S ribosomal protein L29 [Deltaproteobacteria bacterium]|nr:50S ribosomal protein L29 [Deltaproteobacteria bacterium]